MEKKQTMFSDIDLRQLIFTKLPLSWHPYIKLARLDRPIGIWLLLFPCLWSIILASDGIVNITPQTCQTLALFALGAVLMRAAGCIINDLCDIELDAAVERTKTRPLASGEISVRNALRFLIVLLALSLLVLMMLPHLTIVLGVLSLGLVIAYPYMKRITWMPQLFLGLTFNWGALMGWAAVKGHMSSACFYLYISGIFWTLGYDTIYAHQDKEGDALIGIKSTARLFGEKSKLFVAAFYALSLLFLLMARYSREQGLLTPLLSSLPLAQAVWQLRNWDINDPQSCLRIFKSNQAYGWLALLMLSI
jgi:4-hydroxybenzoate polyprenyltransferase